MRYREGNWVIRWLALCLLLTILTALPFAAFSEDQHERFASLTIGQLLGIRVDIGDPLLALTLPKSGLALGLGSNLDLLGGDLSVRAFPPRRPIVDVTGTVLLTTDPPQPVRSLCYFITAYIDDKEFLVWHEVLLAVLDPGKRWSIQLQWATCPELTDLLRFGAQTGYKVYRRVVPENEIGAVCDTSHPGIQLVETFPSDPNRASITFTDGGTDGGKPAIGSAGPLSLQNPLGNLSVDNLGTIGALRVGQIAAPALGSAWIEKCLRVGDDAKISGKVGIGALWAKTARLNIAGLPAVSRANILLDATNLAAPATGRAWELASTAFGGLELWDNSFAVVPRLRWQVTGPTGNVVFNIGDPSAPAAGTFTINDVTAPVGLSCCPPPGGAGAAGNPRFVIDSQGAVGVGCTPNRLAPAGSLKVAYSLGVGMPAPATCGGIATCGLVNVGGLGVGVAAPGGLGNVNIGNNLGVIRDAGIGNDLVVGNDVGIARDLNVGRDVNILNDLLVANDLDVFGDLTVFGIKFFAQPHPADSTKVITYAALEGPEAGTYVRGTAQLVDGEVTIELPESFHLVTSEEGITAQITPLEECNGLYVVEKSLDRIVVKELMSGLSNARFDYLVQGIRKGYEDFDPIREKEDD